ncbi:transposase [Streptomyces avermitilis]|uniref:transposase n=1 Tax=Streptomyces avermitilis TaxID=33903 RepID=UPI0033BF6166
MSLLIAAGQRHDSPQFQPVLKRIRVPRTELGRPRIKPDRVRADRAYGSRANRPYLRRREIQCTVPEKADPVRNRKKLGSQDGRPPKCDEDGYKSAPRRGMRDQPTEMAPGRRHEIWQVGRALRSRRAGRDHQRVAVTSTAATLPNTATVSTVTADQVGRWCGYGWGPC